MIAACGWDETTKTYILNGLLSAHTGLAIASVGRKKATILDQMASSVHFSCCIMITQMD